MAERGGLPEVRREARRWRERLDVAYPHVAALHLPEVVGWIVLGGGSAWGLSYWFVGSSTQDVGSPHDYMTIWFLLSAVVAALWVYRQWYVRPALPEQQRISVWWTTAVSSAIVAGIVGVVIVSGVAADHQARAVYDAGGAAGHIAALRTCEDVTPEWKPRTGLLVCRKAHPFESSKGFPNAWLFPPELLPEDACVPPLESLQAFVPEIESRAAQRCLREKAQRLRLSQECGEWLMFGRITMRDPEVEEHCPREIMADCEVYSVGRTIQHNIQSLLSAQQAEVRYSASSDPDVYLQLACLSVLLGAVSSFARVLRGDVAVRALFGFLLFALVASAIVVFVLKLKAEWWWGGAWGVGVAACASLIALCLVRRARTLWTDCGVLVVHLWPLLPLIGEFVYTPTAFATCPVVRQLEVVSYRTSPAHGYAYAALAWTLVTGFLLPFYRNLPKAS